MGSWNHTCMLSNLHVTVGEEVVVFLLLKNKSDGSNCYTNSFYDVCPVPFYGKYDDYGGVDECHGFGLNMVVEALREQLYEFGQGPNEFHDCEVNKENFDITKLFEADHENRLGVEDFNSWDGDAYDLHQLKKEVEDGKSLTKSQQFELDRLASKIKKEDNFRQVTHVVMHRKVVNHILENWFTEDYVGEGKGTHGYHKSYVKNYFKDVTDSISEYIARLKASKEKEDAENKGSSFSIRFSRRRIFEWDDTNHAGRMLGYYVRGGGESNAFDLIDIGEKIDEYIDANDWDNLALFAKEVLTTIWINSFLSHTRRHWQKMTGSGGQSAEHGGYRALNDAIAKVLDEELAEREEWDLDNDEVEEDEASVEVE